MGTSSLDPRIITVSFVINGQTKTYSSPLNIKAVGTKYANALQNEASITLYNLDKNTQDYLLTETTPFNLNSSPKTITLKAGRESYGTATIYVGNIISSTVSQPPDIGITLKCLTGNFLKNNLISNNFGGQANLEQISAKIAQNTNTVLNFQATNKNIGNFQFTGSALNQVQALNALGGINAYLDDNTLVVKNAQIPIRGTSRILNAQSGLIGIPQFTEQGLRVTYLLDNTTVIGGGVQIDSTVYPAVNGNYVIYKLGFNITSRDIPFYYIAECARVGQ